MKISVCNKICTECGFSKHGSKNTLYAEAFDIMKTGTLFPCHMYLRSISGSESHGTEHLTEVKVCRGYVSYQFLYGKIPANTVQTWNYLMSQLNESDMEDIYTPDELIANHEGLREFIQLNNPLGSTK